MPDKSPMTTQLRDTLLKFGATDDLLQRNLYPLLVNLLRDRLLLSVPSGSEHAVYILPVTVSDKMRTARNP